MRSSNRIRRVPTVSGITLIISAKREWGSLIFFLPAWLAFWTFAGIMVMNWLINPGPSTPRAFVAVWLVGWAFGEAWALYQWFWTGFGREVVKVSEGDLTVRREIIRYGRTRTFHIGAVRNLRASGLFPTNSYWTDYVAQMKLGGGSVGFDYQGRVEKFGIQLSDLRLKRLSPN